MAEHHHHHHHHKSSATRFKERSLRAIEIRRQMEKWGKIGMLILAIVMVLLLIASYFVK